MPKRKFLRYGQLWMEFLQPWFKEKPTIPSKEALAYHALYGTASERSGKMVRGLPAKGAFRKFVKRKADELHRSWNRTEGELGYRAEEAVNLAFKAVDEAWMKAFPPSGPPALGTGDVELRRKFLPVDPDLAERLIKASKERGAKKLRVLTDDAFEQELAALRLGVTLRQTVDLYEMVKKCTSFGVGLVPMETLNRVAERLKPEDLEGLAGGYHEAGLTVGRYLWASGEEKALRLLKGIFETGLFTVTEMELSRKGEGLEIRCIAPTLTIKTTKLLAAFIEGITESLRYKPLSREHAKGIILLTVSQL